VLTTAVFAWIGKPRQLLIFAGAINGLILPIGLSIILIAAANKRIMKGYQHPLWMQGAGWLVVIAMGWMGYDTIRETIGKLFN
jgi:Mn2+/Fe2+ NRAMP family transporter